MLELIKALLSLLLVGMIGYGLFAMHSGRVYCKGRWYERMASPGGFWGTIALYVVGPPVLLYLLWSAR